jgi:aromatic-L-amino-acid decarboxylase
MSNNISKNAHEERSLDPENWDEFTANAHQMLDLALEHMKSCRDRPVWKPVPDKVKQELQEPLPMEAQGARKVSDDIANLVLPYGTGNTHPKFFGWVHGSGTPSGIIAEMMAAAINANLGGRDHAAIYVERQVIQWCREIFEFPASASGLVVSGTSMASLIALKTARDKALGISVRKAGIGTAGACLTAYASTQAHACISKTFDILGLGQDALRPIPVDASYRMDIDALRSAIEKDITDGNQPFCIVGTAGSVNTGSIDDLERLSEIANEYGLWLHVDGAFGALGWLCDEIRPQLKGLNEAHSIAFDFHKWMHVNYDAGFVLIRDGKAHQQSFSSRPDYLAAEEHGLAGGNPWFCEYGLELSRGFRALKVWWQFKEQGLARIAEKISDNGQQAKHLATLVEQSDNLELMAPVALNIVCFRFIASNFTETELDRLNKEIVIRLQELGLAAPSTTLLQGKLAIRVNITNHRTRMKDCNELISECIDFGTLLVEEKKNSIID